MKTKSLAFLFACTMALTACANKQDNQASKSAAETSVKESSRAEAAEFDDRQDIPADTIEYAHVLPTIGKVWAKTPLKVVAPGPKVGIEQFAATFCKQYSNYKPNELLMGYIKSPSGYDEETASYRIVDEKKNGFMSCFINGDLDWDTHCCYWNRNDGHKLVAFSMVENHESWDFQEDALLVFYDFDPATGTMTPDLALVKKVEDLGKQYDTYSVTLPSEGKDIGMLCHNLETNHPYGQEVIYKLRWNGKDFNAEKERDVKIK